METTSTQPHKASGEYYSIPALPFPDESLEPFMSKQTLKLHYGKHHQGYVDKLNRIIQGTKFESLRLEDVIKKSDGALYNNAAQTWNHTFFWNCLSPYSTEPSSGRLFECIEHCFGSLPEFKMRFSKTAEDLFGSGYVWLVKDHSGLLEIRSGSNAYNPLTEDLSPVFTVDVWEHAYYLDYLNVRKRYLENFWYIANWEFMEAMFQNH